MADFPSKVTTETGSQQAQQGGRGLAASVSTTVDIAFLRSIPAILMAVEIVLGLLHWALIAATIWVKAAAYGWVMFVAVTLWILTTVLFLMTVFGLKFKLTFVPWHTTMMVYNGVATVLYLTAFATNAATVYFGDGHLGAAAFFGAVVTVAYGASAFFSYMEWKGDGGNAATSTVPT